MDSLLSYSSNKHFEYFQELHRLGLPLEVKAFSVGARIEHPAALIDRAQSAGEEGKADLTAAGDSLYQDALSLSGDLDGLLDTAETFQTDGGAALTDLRDAAADLRTAVEAMLEVGGDSLTDSGDALLDTLGMAAALAVGVILASSLFRAVFPRLVRPTRSPSSGGPKP